MFFFFGGGGGWLRVFLVDILGFWGKSSSFGVELLLVALSTIWGVFVCFCFAWLFLVFFSFWLGLWWWRNHSIYLNFHLVTFVVFVHSRFSSISFVSFLFERLGMEQRGGIQTASKPWIRSHKKPTANMSGKDQGKRTPRKYLVREQVTFNKTTKTYYSTKLNLHHCILAHT